MTIQTESTTSSFICFPNVCFENKIWEVIDQAYVPYYRLMCEIIESITYLILATINYEQHL